MVSIMSLPPQPSPTLSLPGPGGGGSLPHPLTAEVSFGDGAAVVVGVGRFMSVGLPICIIM